MEHRHAGPAPFFSDAVARVMEDAMVDQEVILGVLIHLTSLAYAAISVGAAGILLGSVEDPLSDDVRAQVENTFLAKLLESLGDGP